MTTTNYAALGEYTAYAQQAKDAADTRFALLHNLSINLARAAKYPQETCNIEKLREKLAAIEACEREMHAAVAQANQKAPLCHKPALTLEQYRRD